MSRHPQRGPRPRRRPPWWPEDEPWPPRGRPPWARGRRPPWPLFLLFPVLFFAFLLAVALSALGGPAPLRWAAVAAIATLAAAVGFAGLAAWRIANAIRSRQRSQDRRRRQFLADVAHELKTPLSVIRAQTEAIGDGVYPGDAEHLVPVLDATRTLERLVDDLRTLALSDSDALELASERVDVGELLGEVAGSQRAAADEAGITLLVEGGNPVLQADAVKLRSVLDNLLANALRHTPKGGLVRLASRAESSWVVVEVADTGSGIPAQLLPSVFDRFTKGPESNGSGLGLAIAREIVVAHGGTISVESEPGRGSTFTVRLPSA
jgi:two-component system sensor histidine kinase BaeS